MSRQKPNTPDYLLLFLTLLLTFFGLLMVYSASAMVSTYKSESGNSLSYVMNQGIAAILGLVCMMILMNIHYSRLRKLVFVFWVGVLFLLVLVLFIGNAPKDGSARSWIDLGPFNLQPSEFAKLAVILYLSVVITNKGDKIERMKNGLFPCLVIIAITSGLIMLQPDFGSTAILVLGSFAVLWTGGMRTKHLLRIGALGALFMLLYVFIPSLLHPLDGNYRLDRFLTLQDPWRDPAGAGYQMINSLFAFGHGGLTGTGIGNSIQKLHFLTQPYSDFIFSIIGEELGFLMTVLFLIMYALFIWRGIIVSLRCPNKFASLAGVGIMSTIGIQALINLLGVTNTIPMTGVTLPLISYGGSSVLATLISMGIVLGISKEQTATTKKR